MSKLQLGASTWCFHGMLPPELKGALDTGAPYGPEQARAVHAYFAQLASALRRSSIKSIELWQTAMLQDAQVQGQFERLSAAKLISSMHAPFGRHLDLSSLDEDVRRAGVRACTSAAHFISRLGGRIIVVHGSSAVDDLSEKPARMRQSAESIAEIADACRGLGVRVAVEFLVGPHAVGGTAEELLVLLETVGRPNIGVCVDVNHVFPADQLFPAVRTLGSRILTLHVSDYDGVEEMHWLPMQGVIDWPGLIGALREVGYSGPFMYEVRFEAASIGGAVSVIEDNYRAVMEAAGV